MYNLLSEKWIPVHTGLGIQNYSIYDALTYDAFRIVGNPMETLGIYRFLAAYASNRPADENRFFLDDPEFPIMQSAVTSGSVKSISYLTPDIPTGSNSIHFRHNTLDADKFFCAACIARALCALPAFCTVGGQGLRPSINGGPPVYFMPFDAHSVKRTVEMNFVDPEYSYLPWMHSSSERMEFENVSIAHGLTFQPRSVCINWLDRVAECTRCGEVAGLVARQMTYTPGDRYVGDSWVDPHALYNKKTGKPIRAFGVRADWKEFVEKTWAREDVNRPAVQHDSYLVVGAVTDKARFDDVFEVVFRP